jgi:hypothetical protein
MGAAPVLMFLSTMGLLVALFSLVAVVGGS